jgi:hypothetical protein
MPAEQPVTQEQEQEHFYTFAEMVNLWHLQSDLNFARLDWNPGYFIGLDSETLSVFHPDDHQWHPLIVRFADLIAADWFVCYGLVSHPA